MRLIDADALKFNRKIHRFIQIDRYTGAWPCILLADLCDDCKVPTIEAEPVKHGRWILKANKEKTNCRWNVTAECSECCDEGKEIWAGFFPNVPDCIARDVALLSAESVKLSNYCPNCGARMDGGADNV